GRRGNTKILVRTHGGVNGPSSKGWIVLSNRGHNPLDDVICTGCCGYNDGKPPPFESFSLFYEVRGRYVTGFERLRGEILRQDLQRKLEVPMVLQNQAGI